MKSGWINLRKAENMNKISFSDVNITCMDCGKIFIFSAGEQAFFASKALSLPKRCPECRKQRKLSIVPDSNSMMLEIGRQNEHDYSS
jgi:Zn finger protein HypA/HybF involved in hydrogenase expression